MKKNRLPKYTEEKRKGNIGEAFVQYLLSNFCLVHKIDGSNDVGNDLICELVKDEYPTNLLFYVQVKYHKDKPDINPRTKEYWKGSPIPVYLFWVQVKNESGLTYMASDFTELKSAFKELKASYLRYTPKLHNPRKHKNEDFKDYDEMQFKRDLIIDYTRTQYVKGFTPIVEPRMFLNVEDKSYLGFRQFVLYTSRVIPEYSKDILEQSWTNLLTTAVLLLKKGGKRNLKRAKESILLAKKLLVYADRERTAIFRDTLETYGKEISKKIENLESSKNSL